MSYNSNASPLLKKRCLLWTTSVATRAPQEARSKSDFKPHKGTALLQVLKPPALDDRRQG